MIVFDVVCLVSPEAVAMVQPGRYREACLIARFAADRHAAHRNDHRQAGLAYHVEPHEESCPGRAKRPNENHPVAECTCQ